MSSVSRFSEKTSVLVSALQGFPPTFVGALHHPALACSAEMLACERPVPFGKLTAVKLLQVTGHATNVSGSIICSSRCGTVLKVWSPVNWQPPPGGSPTNG